MTTGPWLLLKFRYECFLGGFRALDPWGFSDSISSAPLQCTSLDNPTFFRNIPQLGHNINPPSLIVLISVNSLMRIDSWCYYMAAFMHAIAQSCPLQNQIPVLSGTVWNPGGSVPPSFFCRLPPANWGPEDGRWNCCWAPGRWFCFVVRMKRKNCSLQGSIMWPLAFHGFLEQVAMVIMVCVFLTNHVGCVGWAMQFMVCCAKSYLQKTCEHAQTQQADTEVALLMFVSTIVSS